MGGCGTGGDRPRDGGCSVAGRRAGSQPSGALSVQHLDLYYGDHQALKDVNIDIPDREVTSFIGPSGCGKSTLLRCLNRMNDLVKDCRIEGTITLDGEDIYQDYNVTSLRQQVGMVFQKANPLPHEHLRQRCLRPARLGIKSHSELEGIVEESLKRAALWDEVKDKLKSRVWAFPAASSSVCALPALSR